MKTEVSGELLGIIEQLKRVIVSVQTKLSPQFVRRHMTKASYQIFN